MDIEEIVEVTEDKRPGMQITLPIAVDLGMIIALIGLCVWIGRQAERIDTMAVQTQEIRAEIVSVQRSTNSIDIAALKERSVAQDHELLEMREFLGKRLDRIEQKLDRGR